MAKGMAGRQQAEQATELGSARAAEIKEIFFIAGADLVTAFQQVQQPKASVLAWRSFSEFLLCIFNVIPST